jgi:molecular chaperone GrpE
MAEPQASETDEATDAERTGAEPDPQLLRALADLDNLRKRYERQLALASQAERARVISLWLPVVDDLERALEHADGGPMAEGLRAVYEHAISLLERLGYTRFDDVGKPFDPARHEAVGAIDADAPPSSIVAVVQPGYERMDEVLRPARVVVARAQN